jgi:hypothetical protein
VGVAEDKLKRLQEISNRGLQDKLPADKRAIFDEAMKRGLVKDFPGASVIEPALAIGSSIIAEPISGLAGIAGSLLPGPEGQGARAVESTRQALTFQPRTEAGKKGLQAVGEFVEPLSSAIGSVEQELGDIGFEIGGPTGGAIGKTIPTALMEAIGLGLAKKATKSTGRLIDSDGNPTQELIDALQDSGVKFDELTPESVNALNENRFSVPEEVLRSERFKELNIPATKGDVTQDFKTQALESRLLESASDDSAGPVRALRLEQSRGIIGELNELVDNLGVPGDVGNSLKEALSGRKKLLRTEKNALYSQASEAAPEIKALPLITDSIEDALPDLDTFDDLSITAPDSVNQFKTAMARFGIDKSEDALNRLEKLGIEPQPLTVGNFERLRKTLNRIERADQTGAASVMTGPVKNALDSEADLIDSAIKAGGVTDPTVLDSLKGARQRVVTLKTEFSPQSITGKLIDSKRDGVTPVIEASKVFNEIFGPNKAPELLDRTLESLNKAGSKGKRAIKDLQASAVMKLIDDSLKAQTRKIKGEKVLGGVPFQKSFESLNQGGRLDKLFSTDKGSLKKLKQISEVLKDLTPPSGAVPKGSASVVLDALNGMGLFALTNKIPGIGPFAQAIRLVAEKGADKAAVDAALKSRPKVKRALRAMQKDFPELATVLGVASIDIDKEGEE